MDHTNGVFCISLDFEKFWGVRDVTDFHTIEHRFKKVRDVVPAMLELFKENEIHASWAVVGLLGYRSFDELVEKNASGKISYSNPDFSPYPISTDRYGQIPFELLSGTDEINQILKTPFQELASHTYAHYYTLEEGQTAEEFVWDVQQMTNWSKDLNYSFRSIVFPRNQVNTKYLRILKDQGYLAFRGNQENKDWANVRYGDETTLQKIRRVLDAYFAFSETGSTPVSELQSIEGLVNVPASRFMRPANKGKWLEKRKVGRIKNEMSHAAKNGTLYHLWWHPHNFTFNADQSLEELREIIRHFKTLQHEYGFSSMNMHEIAIHVNR